MKTSAELKAATLAVAAQERRIKALEKQCAQAVARYTEKIAAARKVIAKINAELSGDAG